MSNQDLEHLFKPGSGVVPPYLAGRKREQEFFRDCVSALKKRVPIGQDMIVYGPRGNGKTTLLSYLQKQTLKKRGRSWMYYGRHRMNWNIQKYLLIWLSAIIQAFCARSVLPSPDPGERQASVTCCRSGARGNP